MRKRILLLLAALGVASVIICPIFSYYNAMNAANEEARNDASNLLERSTQMFIVSTVRFHDEFQKASGDPAAQNRILDDWNRTIFAVDQAVINDFGEGKARVRLIGDTEIFGIKPLGGENTVVESPFEKEAGEVLAKGEKSFEKFEEGFYKIAAPLPSQAHRGCAECHFAVLEGLDADYTREIVLGSLNAYIPLASYHAAARSEATTVTLSLVLTVLAISAVLYFVLDRTVVKPVNATAAVLKDIAQGEGDLTARLTVARKDEIGALAEGFNTFLGKLQSIIRDVAGNTSALASASEELSATAGTMEGNANGMTALAASSAAVTDSASGNISNVAAGVEQVSASAGTVAQSAKDISGNLTEVGKASRALSKDMDAIATSSDQMATDVNTVASSIEELSATLREVSTNSTQAAQVASRATETANRTSQSVAALGESAQRIGNVVDIIQGVAAQTNLLALNATIEAASAGAAGKGFAVVANEVKELAKQTASATNDIRQQVQDMQGDTAHAVAAINEIVEVINEMDRISTSIAASVEEQTAVTSEVSKSIASVARSVTEVAGTVQNSARRAMQVSGNVDQAVTGVDTISASAAELANGANEIASHAAMAAKGMNQAAADARSLSSAAGETSTGASETTAAARSLAELAARLRGLVGQFKI